jgi:lipopolysaccharide export system permease protein
MTQTFKNPAKDFSQTHILIRYAGREFIIKMLGILFGLCALLLVFDIAANADDVLQHHSDIFQAIGNYARLRAPAIISLAIPFCVLLSMMSVFARMVRHQELVALRSVGVSIYRLISVFALVILAVVITHFIFANLVLPQSQSQMRQWESQDYRGKPNAIAATHDPRWITAGNLMIYVGDVQDDGFVLRNVDVIERGDNGEIQKYFEISKAIYDGSAWQVQTTDKMQMNLSLPFLPESFESMENEIGEMSYGALMRNIYADRVVDEDQKRLYWLWLQRKLAEPLSSLIMLLMAAPLALQMSRKGDIMKTSGMIVAAGFCFFITERLLLSLGETGYLPPLIAVWSPMAIFSLLAFWVILLIEG